MNKSRFKYFLYYAFLFLILSFSLTACVKHGCTDERALNWDSNANKAGNSSCIYTNTPFIGIWLMNDTIQSSSPDYCRQDTLIVNAVDTSTSLLNITLYNGINVNAYVTKSNFTIPIQTIGQLTYYGSGNGNGTTLSLDYHSGDLQHIRGSGTRK